MEVEGTGYEPGVAGHEWAGGGRQAAGCRPKYEDVFSRVFTDSRAARTVQSCDSTTDHLTDVNVTDSSAG